tara:strand:- start:16 stop:957 length:942 start_codon:yes stop_codon:yes gene_type:complete
MKIILFGIGYWGKNHLRELSNNDKVTSLVVVDPFFESYTDLMNKYSDVKFYHSFSDALAENKNIDGAVIATPPSTHFEITKKCLKNGIHVLVEKPMVESLDELKQLNEIAQNDLVLMSGHTYLYNPAIRKIKDIIDDGLIGKIMFIHSQRLNFGIMRKDVDVFLSLAPHDISLVQFFLNDQQHIKMIKNQSNYTFSPYDDFSSTHLKYKNNVYAQIDVSWYYPQKIRSLTIVGTKKTIIFDDVSKKILLYDINIDSNYNHINNEFKEIEFDKNISPLTNEIKHFIEYIKQPSECITGFNHTFNVINVIEEYYK